MLSLARSRYRLLAQLVFHLTNGLGVLLGLVYNTSTPDLYPNNAHHKLGWVLTATLAAQGVIGLLAGAAGVLGRKASNVHGEAEDTDERGPFIPISDEVMTAHQSPFAKQDYRFSGDSGQGSSVLSSSGLDSPRMPLRSGDGRDHKEYHVDDHADDDDDGFRDIPMTPASYKDDHAWVVGTTVQRIAGKISSRFWRVLTLAYNIIDRTILPLGFVGICTGIITFGRFFVGFPHH